MNTASFLYCFVLGTNHTLCKVEILNVLSFKKIPFKVIEASQETLIIESPKEIEKYISINDFGSTAKLIKIFTSVPLDSFLESFAKEITKKKFKDFFLPPKEKRIAFGLSLYHSGTKLKELNKIRSLALKVCKKLKDQLESSGVTSWFLYPKERILSTVSVDRNSLLKRGFEFIICVGQHWVYLGKTLTVQDYKSYSFRDYGRPKRDSRAGMIPLKVAKIMINLTRKEKDSVFLDPFCGSGTFLQELILLGYKKIIGADIDNNAISNTKTNLEWLFKNYHFLKKENHHIEFINCDVRQISSRIFSRKIDAIISEPYLGSPKLKFTPLNLIKKEIKEIENLYIQAFKEFKKILKANGVIAIIFPVIRYKDQFFYLEILNDIKKIGFQNKNFLPVKKINSTILGLQTTNRNSIIYYRPGQTVSREIFLFTMRI